CCKRHRGEDYW
nr:immunoglobulin heavy chain junction region [Macaca mulatta]